MKQTKKSILMDILKQLWRFKPKLALTMILELIFVVMSQFITILTPAIIMTILSSPLDWQCIVLTIVGLFSLFGIVSFFSHYFTESNSNEYIDVRLQVFASKWVKKISDLDYQYYESKEAQLALEKSATALYTNNDVGLEGVYRNIVVVATCVVSLFISLVFISQISLWVALPLILLSWLSYFIYDKCNQLYLINDEKQTSNYSLTRYFRNISKQIDKGKDIRLYQLNPFLAAKMAENEADLQVKVRQSKKYLLFIAQSEVVIGFVRDGLTYGLLIYLMIQQKINFNSFVLTLGMMMNYSTRFVALTKEISNLKKNLDISKRYYEFIQDKHVISTEGEKTADSFEIVFDHVSFAYPGSDKNVLEDFNLCFRAGEKLALVGINGAGKTTLVKLLCGLYEPTAGNIFVNGINLKQINKQWYFSQLGVIFQEINLFAYTIGENVSSQIEGEYELAKVEQALQMADVDKVVSELDKGAFSHIGTEIAADGINLSGGQLQKLLMAKAIYKNPTLLVLDEPTAALDAIAERNLYEKYNAVTQGKSALFISHRLASTRFCDRIIFLENGQIIEEGTHESLMRLNQKYAEMFEVQAQYYKEQQV